MDCVSSYCFSWEKLEAFWALYMISLCSHLSPLLVFSLYPWFCWKQGFFVPYSSCLKFELNTAVVVRTIMSPQCPRDTSLTSLVCSCSEGDPLLLFNSDRSTPGPVMKFDDPEYSSTVTYKVGWFDSQACHWWMDTLFLLPMVFRCVAIFLLQIIPPTLPPTLCLYPPFLPHTVSCFIPPPPDTCLYWTFWSLGGLWFRQQQHLHGVWRDYIVWGNYVCTNSRNIDMYCVSLFGCHPYFYGMITIPF